MRACRVQGTDQGTASRPLPCPSPSRLARRPPEQHRQPHAQPSPASGGVLTLARAQDWLDIDFAISEDVDFIAVSFVKSADVIHNLRSYVSARADRKIELIAKLESYDSVPNVQDIVEAADCVMVARGDLGAPGRHASGLRVLLYLCVRHACRRAEPMGGSQRPLPPACFAVASGGRASQPLAQASCLR